MNLRNMSLVVVVERSPDDVAMWMLRMREKCQKIRQCLQRGEFRQDLA